MIEAINVLRLHNSENTGGCSPAVLAALASLRAIDIASYPDYEAVQEQCAALYHVTRDRVALTNGLDEGILALAIAQLRRCGGSATPEAIVPEPAFDVFRISIEVSGGALVQVHPRPDFSFALDEVLAAITPNTRLVFITNPNNPTGTTTSAAAIHVVARRVPSDAIVFVDETYAEFSGQTFLPELAAHANVIIGRSFSKAFGLAGLRFGCLIGAPEALAPAQRVIPIYSVNVAALAAMEAAVMDRCRLESYLREVDESKALIYAACNRHRLLYWRSDANFVLVRLGDDVLRIVEELARRGIRVRNESTQVGCAGCVRITAGIVAHTNLLVEALDGVLHSRSRH